eukprot:gene13451-13577_t
MYNDNAAQVQKCFCEITNGELDLKTQDVELAASWVPSKVEEVIQPDKFTLSLRLRTPLSQGWLHLSWHPTAARVCMGQPPVRGDVAEAFSFAELASNQLRGLVLVSAGLPAAWERVMQLDFGVRPGEPPSRSLLCEVMAKYSNVVLVSEDKSVIQAAYQQVKVLCMPPDSHGIINWGKAVAKWPSVLATSLCHRLRSGDFAASSCPETSRFSALGAYPQRHECVHDMLDEYYRSIQAAELYAGLHQQLAGAVRQALKKARGRLRSFEQQMAAAGDAAAVQRQADLIVANIYRIPAGAEQLQAEDWDSGEPVMLQLDPTKTPMAQAEGLYKRARKLRRAVDAIQPLMEAVQQDLDYLETVELELTQMPPGGFEQELAALREVQDELVEAKVIKPPPEAALSAKAASKGRKAQKRQQKSAASGLSNSSAAAAASAGGGAGLRQYDSPGGFLVLVGRNNKQNDVLSHQIAKPGDVWLHVRGLPGSHTVIKVPPGQDPSQDDLQFAADLAAYFSKAREAGKVDVIVARAENLKKFKGAKPGQVLVTKEEGNVVGRPGSRAAAQQLVS